MKQRSKITAPEDQASISNSLGLNNQPQDEIAESKEHTPEETGDDVEYDFITDIESQDDHVPSNFDNFTSHLHQASISTGHLLKGAGTRAISVADNMAADFAEGYIAARQWQLHKTAEAIRVTVPGGATKGRALTLAAGIGYTPIGSIYSTAAAVYAIGLATYNQLGSPWDSPVIQEDPSKMGGDGRLDNHPDLPSSPPDASPISSYPSYPQPGLATPAPGSLSDHSENSGVIFSLSSPASPAAAASSSSSLSSVSSPDKNDGSAIIDLSGSQDALSSPIITNKGQAK